MAIKTIELNETLPSEEEDHSDLKGLEEYDLC